MELPQRQTSTVVLTKESFAHNLPVLMEVWKNRRISDKLMADRLKKAVETMKETGEIMRRTRAERSRVYDNINTAWGHVIKNEWPVEDTRYSERHDVSNNDLKPLVETLNQAEGYARYREVPTQGLDHWK